MGAGSEPDFASGAIGGGSSVLRPFFVSDDRLRTWRFAGAATGLGDGAKDKTIEKKYFSFLFCLFCTWALVVGEGKEMQLLPFAASQLGLAVRCDQAHGLIGRQKVDGLGPARPDGGNTGGTEKLGEAANKLALVRFGSLAAPSGAQDGNGGVGGDVRCLHRKKEILNNLLIRTRFLRGRHSSLPGSPRVPSACHWGRSRTQTDPTAHPRVCLSARDTVAMILAYIGSKDVEDALRDGAVECLEVERHKDLGAWRDLLDVLVDGLVRDEKPGGTTVSGIVGGGVAKTLTGPVRRGCG